MKVVRKGLRWCVVNDNGKVLASCITKEAAERRMDDIQEQLSDGGVLGFMTAREGHDVITYDLPEKAVSAEQKQNLISSNTLEVIDDVSFIEEVDG